MRPFRENWECFAFSEEERISKKQDYSINPEVMWKRQVVYSLCRRILYSLFLHQDPGTTVYQDKEGRFQLQIKKDCPTVSLSALDEPGPGFSFTQSAHW